MPARRTPARALLAFALAALCLDAFAQAAPKTPATPKAPPSPKAASPASSPTPAARSGLSGREWLDANPAAADFADRLGVYAREASSAEAALDLISDYYHKLSDADGRSSCAALAGRYAELLSRYQAAADWYQRAATAQAGAVDAELSLRAAYCLMSIGEFKAADPLVAASLASASAFSPAGNLSSAIRLRAKAQLARYWLALFEAQYDGLEGQVIEFVAEGENAAFRPEGLLLLSMLDKSRIATGTWKSADCAYAKKLISDFPDSPEALILAAVSSDSPRGPLRLSESPLWLLNGLLVNGPDSGFKALERDAGPSPSTSASPVQAKSPLPSSAQPSPSAGKPGSGGQRITAYQIGGFAIRKNAESLSSDLKAKNFQASIREKKGSKGQALYVVVVQAGADPGLTDLRLKEAGYESLPLFD